MSYQTPDFPSPKRGNGSQLQPDFGSADSSASTRGKYPADSGGPPQTKVGQGRSSGSPQDLDDMTTSNESNQAPAKSPRFVASRDI